MDDLSIGTNWYVTVRGKNHQLCKKSISLIQSRVEQIGSESYETDKEIIVVANITILGIFNKVLKK